MAPGTYILNNGDKVIAIIELLANGRLQHLTYDRVVIAAGYWRAKGADTCLDLDGRGTDRAGRVRDEQCWRVYVPLVDGNYVITRIGDAERLLAIKVIKDDLARYTRAMEPSMEATQAIPPPQPSRDQED